LEREREQSFSYNTLIRNYVRNYSFYEVCNLIHLFSRSIMNYYNHYHVFLEDHTITNQYFNPTIIIIWAVCVYYLTT